MRLLLAAAGALIAVGVATPTFAAPPTATTTATQRSSTDTTVLAATKKKKRKKSESASIDSIGKAIRDKRDLEIKATVAKEGRDCQLKVKWKDGSTDEDEDTSKEDKTCEFSISVPDGTRVVGEATAELIVKDSSGKKVASASKTFTVK